MALRAATTVAAAPGGARRPSPSPSSAGGSHGSARRRTRAVDKCSRAPPPPPPPDRKYSSTGKSASRLLDPPAVAVAASSSSPRDMVVGGGGQGSEGGARRRQSSGMEAAATAAAWPQARATPAAAPCAEFAGRASKGRNRKRKAGKCHAAAIKKGRKVSGARPPSASLPPPSAPAPRALCIEKAEALRSCFCWPCSCSLPSAAARPARPHKWHSAARSGPRAASDSTSVARCIAAMSARPLPAALPLPLA